MYENGDNNDKGNEMEANNGIQMEMDDDAEDYVPNPNQNLFDFEELVEEEETNHFAQQNPDYKDFQKLHSNTDCTVIDALCMIYTFAIRHNLTWEAIEDLVRLSNRIIGSQQLQPSKYIFKKKMSQITNFTSIKHFFCHKCDLYFGTIENINRMNERICSNCNAEIQIDTKYKKNHFITMPIKDQLRDVLERNSDNLKFNFGVPDTSICDVTCEVE